MQHATSVFDNTLEPVPSFAYEIQGNDDLYVFAHRNIYSGEMAVALWNGNQKPTSSEEKKLVDIKFLYGNFRVPVYADLRTGEVSEIPVKNIIRQGTSWTFKNIPVYDSPILITDKSLLTIE